MKKFDRVVDRRFQVDLYLGQELVTVIRKPEEKEKKATQPELPGLRQKERKLTPMPDIA